MAKYDLSGMVVPTTPQEVSGATGQVDLVRQGTPLAVGLQPATLEEDLLGDINLEAAQQQLGLRPFDIQRAASYENVRPAAIAAGGALGAEYGAGAGAPFGPIGAGAGAVAGGILGAGLTVAGLGALERKPAIETTKEILSEAEQELMFAGGAAAIGPAIKALGPQVGRLFGVGSEDAKEIARIAANRGVPLSLLQVSDNPVVRGFPKVAGVFPFVGGPMRQSLTAVDEALAAKLKGADLPLGTVQAASRDVRPMIEGRSVPSYLDMVAPNATLHQIGIDTVDAAQTASKEFKDTAAGLYNGFYNLAEQLGNPEIVPTTQLKTMLQELRSPANRPVRADGTIIEAPRMNSELDGWVDDILQLPDYISPAQVRSLQEDLNRFYGVASIKGLDESTLGRAKAGIENAFNNMDVSRLDDAGAANDLVSSLNSANAFYSAGMTLFGSPAGQKMLRADRNLFNSKPFKAGSITPDQIMPALFKARSPQFMRDFRAIVGPEQFRQASRGFLDQAASKSSRAFMENGRRVEMFDYGALKKELGLTSQEGKDTLKVMLEGSPVQAQEFEDLIRLGEAQGAVDIAQSSTFLQRRLVLGGPASLKGMVAKGVTGASIVPVLIARGSGRFLSSPKVLRWMTTAIDDTAPEAVRRVALGLALEQYARDIELQRQEEREQ